MKKRVMNLGKPVWITFSLVFAICLAIGVALGLIKGPEDVLPVGEVDSGLPPDAAVHLGKECGGDLDIGDAPHIEGGHKSGDIAHYTAAECDEGGGPVSAQRH